MTNRRGLAIAGGLLRALVTAVFLAAAAMKLTATPFEVQGFAHFGYAPWFMYAIGLLQLAGAVALWVPRLVGPAALGLSVMMVGAVVSHWRAGDPLAMMTPAIVLVVVTAGLAYAYRRDVAAWMSPLAAARA